MIPVTTFAGKTVAVFGLGLSGIASAKALLAGGASVAAWDDGEVGRKAAEAAGIPLVDLRTADWSRFAALVLAPGVPLTHPEPHWVVLKAREANVLKASEARTAGNHQVEVIGDTELFFRERARVAPAAKVIGITGTNGKSTTTALTAHLLHEAGFSVSMGGNIGRAVLELAPLAADQVYVIEFSSFQLDLTPSIHCNAAALLNITPDHLDRHGTMAQYEAVKQTIFVGMGGGETRVIGVDGDNCRAIWMSLCHAGGGNNAVPVAVLPEAVAWLTGRPSAESNGPGIVLRGTQLIENGAVLADLAGIGSLRGAHNAQNAAAALALARGVGADPDRLRKGLATFPGLAHRMEEIGHIGHVLFINDSKATNADSAEKALAAFDGNIHWILGGKSKEGGITTLARYFPRIAKAYLIGAASEEFAATLEAGEVPFERSGTLDIATNAAARDAADSGSPAIVLLSPACASYDQFRNFEIRGDAFRKLVSALPGLASRAGP